MMDPEELTAAHLPPAWRRKHGAPARDEAGHMAIYALAYRRRARGAAMQSAIAATLLCLLASLLMAWPWLAVAGFAACPLVYTAGCWTLDGWLSARLGISRAALSACIERFVASPGGAAQAALLERGEAQIRIDRDRHWPIAGHEQPPPR